MRGAFNVSYVEYSQGEYQFHVNYPATSSKLDAYVLKDGWIFGTYKVRGIGHCRLDLDDSIGP
jgi:hypothetical protein